MSASITDLVGKTFAEVTGAVGGEELNFAGPEGAYRFYYEHDCCASCSITDIAGDLTDLMGSPILSAEEVSNEDAKPPEHAESYTWTFYKFATIKGYVTVSWLGESNGYYNESVSFKSVGEANP